MYLDPNHFRTSEIADELLQAAQELRSMQVVATLKPVLSMNGNQFCFLYGELPNDCVVGFGDTAGKAMMDFINNFWNYKAVNPNKK